MSNGEGRGNATIIMTVLTTIDNRHRLPRRHHWRVTRKEILPKFFCHAILSRAGILSKNTIRILGVWNIPVFIWVMYYILCIMYLCIMYNVYILRYVLLYTAFHKTSPCVIVCPMQCMTLKRDIKLLECSGVAIQVASGAYAPPVSKIHNILVCDFSECMYVWWFTHKT